MPPDLPAIAGVEFYGEWKAAKKPRRLPRHKNNGLEIVLVSKGELKWAVEHEETELRADTLFYTLPWQEHGGVEEMQPSCEISYLCLTLAGRYAKARDRFRFHRAFGFTAAEEQVISSALTDCRVQAFPADEEIVWLFARFFELTRAPGLLRQSSARDTVKLMVAALARLTSSGWRIEARVFEAERRVRHFARVLAERHAEPWTLRSMGDACRLGRTQFSELFKRCTGDTPITHLNRARLREAQRLLGTSPKSITEIAHAVGFGSSQYFATVFKEFTDVDARSFRALAKGRKQE